MGKESEVAELAVRCLKSFRELQSSAVAAPAAPPSAHEAANEQLSGEDIQRFWNLHPELVKDSSLKAVKSCDRDLKADIDWRIFG